MEFKRDALKQELITEDEYALLSGLIRERIGITLKGDKRLTLHMKVSHRLRILGLASYREYYDYILNDPTGREIYVFASHITNNETFFFREKPQLDLFSELLKDVKRVKQKRNDNTLKVLSCCCSSGEEPYTLNILIFESGLFAWGWETSVIGMDIDTVALAKAEAAIFSRNSVRSFNGNGEFLGRYFNMDGERYRLKPTYRRGVAFRHGNVIAPESFTEFGKMDIIFCRNSMIYMDDNAIGKAVGIFHEHIADDGYLFIGSSESLINKTNLFVPVYKGGVIIYRKSA